MKITPIEIQQKTFSTSFFGYRKAEVEAFLEELADMFKEFHKDYNAMKDELARLQRELEACRAEEKLIKEAIIKAEKVSENIKEQAKLEAAQIIEKAKNEGQRIINEAQNQKEKILQEINQLKGEKERLYLELKTALKTLDEYIERVFVEK